MFEKKKNNKKLKKPLNLAEYNLQFSKSNLYLASTKLQIPKLCEVVCNLETRPSDSPELSGTCKVLLSSLDFSTNTRYSKYTERYTFPQPD